MNHISVKTNAKEEIADITGQVRKLAQQQKTAKLAIVFIPHTTAGVTINENADPTVKTDILLGLKGLRLEEHTYRHLEGNSPSHIKASLIGSSVLIPLNQGELVLGTWQGIYFCEFDGPRSRKAWVEFI